MPAFQKFNQFVEDVYHGNHNLYSDPIKFLISPEASPPLITDVSVANITTASLANVSSDTILTVSSEQVGGIYSLVLDDLTVAVSGGNMGPFRYVTLYNSVNDLLIGFSDYGTEITVVDGATFKIDFGAKLFDSS